MAEKTLMFWRGYPAIYNEEDLWQEEKRSSSSKKETQSRKYRIFMKSSRKEGSIGT